MSEFYVGAKYKMALPNGLQGVAGGVIMPSGVSRHTLERRDLEKKYPHLARRLIDPQVYLSGLNPATCRKACVNLASYDWFTGVAQKPFNSDAQKQSEWAKGAREEITASWTRTLPEGDQRELCIRKCLEFQKKLGVEAFILPAPLTSDINTDFSAELDWLETGLRLAAEIDAKRPAYMTLALSDTTLRGTDPWSNPLLDLVLDQVTARGVWGVYLVLEQANEEGYYCTHPNTVGGLLRLCSGFKLGGVSRIMVSYVGTAGLVALSVGADAWVTGWYRSERRLRLSDFEIEEGRSVPAYYSHPLGGEFHMESDLDRVVSKGFLPRIADRTAASAGLLDALGKGKPTSSVADWQYRPTNVAASIEHFLLVCVRETDLLSKLSDADQEGAMAGWLESAARLANDLYAVGGFHQRTAVNHQHGWKAAFDAFRKQDQP